MPGHDSDAHRLIRLERERESAGEHAIEVEHQGSVQEDGSRGGDADVVLHGRPRDANDGSTRSSTGSGVEDAHRHLRLAVAVDVHQVIPDGDHLLVVAHVLACAVMVSVQKSKVFSVPSKSHGPRVRSSGPSSSSYAQPDSYVARSRPA